MKFITVYLFVLSFHTLTAQTTQTLLTQLDSEIGKRAGYVERKMHRIDSLKSLIAQADQRGRYRIYLDVYDEYKSFVYDSAFVYARKLRETANALHGPVGITNARIKIGFVLVSAGMFNEALDTLRSVRSKALPDSIRTEYFYLMARTCYDLADFNRHDLYRKLYTQRANNYIDSALSILPSASIDYQLMSGLRHLHLQQMESAKSIYENLLVRKDLGEQEFAIVSSTLSFIYFYSGEQDKAKQMLIQAAIADIQSSTKETVAMQNLADMFYKEGETELAYRYIQVAREDADFYGARQRQAQVGAIFPIIEGKQLSITESKRKSLLIYSLLITIFTISSIAFAVVIYKQNKKLQEARKIISNANHSLEETNRHLTDANKIKEEYIWYYFNATAEYINKLDALKKSLDLKLMTKKLEELRFTVDSINIKHERESLYHNFDKVFLKLFPDFVTLFNSMFPDEEKVVLKEGQLLNTELRIFALIRMGIHDHDRIAKILDYSVTTIYTYKTRVRNKAKVPHEEFDRRIMAIPAI
jgi:DNA-binding CsgD family transcriptional regulator